MIAIRASTLIFLVTVGLAAGQSGVTAGGQAYVCVAPGTCPVSPGGNVIDPRIVTPGELCPPGLIPCFTLTAACGVRSVTPPATSGQTVAGAYPWQAYLRNSTHSFAGSGVLIDSQHVLTAAHKVAANVGQPQTVTVIMGVFNPTNLANTQSSPVAQIQIHPDYDARTLKNDIAILRLANPIILGQQDNIVAACLTPTGPSTSNPFIGQRCVVSGWGQTAFNTNDAPTNPMKQVFVNIVDYATCRTSYSAANLLGNNVDVYLDPMGEICAGGETMQDACTQDGGSPLVCPDATGTYYVAGLVIWGKNCGQPGVFGVYVSIPYYRNWIDTTLTALNAG